MIKVKIISDEDKIDTEKIIRSAIFYEIKKLEISLKRTQKELNRFENKYNISSEYFLSNYTAEDLNGKDVEYVKWAGEIKMREIIALELSKLTNIQYES